MSFFQVVIPPLDQPYVYQIPTPTLIPPEIGQRVLIPLRNQLVTGYLWEPAPDPGPEQSVKMIDQILDPQPLFSPSLRAFLSWISRYYHHPLGQVVKASLPPGLALNSLEVIEITPRGAEALTGSELPRMERELLSELAHRRRPWGKLDLEQKKMAARLQTQGLIRRIKHLSREKTRTQKVKWVYPGPRFSKEAFSEKYQALFEFLQRPEGLPLTDLRLFFPLPSRLLNQWRRKGLLEIREQPCFRNPLGEIFCLEERPETLTTEQEQALLKIKRALADGRYRSLLLHGVTGSGKTEIYLRATEETLALNRQALILVPEIGLVPQMEGRFRTRFGEKIAVLHSGLSPRERLDQWRRIQMGETPVVVGTRSAVFAPLESLGLVVVDEEHDPSLKQQESLRYHARDLALVRAQLVQAVAVLGSATPSLTTLHLLDQKKMAYLPLTRRVRQRAMPEINLIDLKQFRKGRRETPLSPPLLEAVKTQVEAGHQILFFLNRRGFEPLTLCTLCGAPVRCRNCSVSLTFHAASQELLCHLCGFHQPLSPLCPACGREGIKTIGWGTEKVEKELKMLFPETVIDRLDRDTVSKKNAHYQILKRFQDRKTQILVGTQMITKGHDFPGVTLIGVLCADLSLNWPDFRSGERTFQLLAQVAGRAGRGPYPGKVFIQTYNPDHYIFEYVRRHDYLGFYRQELKFRREFEYPPFTRLVHILIQGNPETGVRDQAQEIGNLLSREREKRNLTTSLTLLGPVPAPISKIKGRYRWQILLKGKDPRMLHQISAWVQETGKHILKGSGVQLILDVDPVDML
jgi:primosomal protein N' (replication factor Y)